MVFNKCISLRNLLAISVIIFVSACTDYKDDIPLFESYISENINKISDDPYISSTYKPGEPLFMFLSQMQRNRADFRLLELLIEQGDTDAMVWWSMINVGNIELRNLVLERFYRAMSAGNPYAALQLSDAGEACQWLGQRSLSSRAAIDIGVKPKKEFKVCSKEYWDLAVEGFKKQADQGDLRAQYFLLFSVRPGQPKPKLATMLREDYINEIIRFSNQHYYKPLMDYVDSILVWDSESKQFESQNDDVYNLAVQLLTIAANNNYLPAIYLLSVASDNRESMLEKGLKLGGVNSITHKLLDSKRPSDDRCFYNYLHKDVTGDFLVHREQLSPEQIIEIESKVNEFVKKTHYPIYIDALTPSAKWRDQ
ncbi:hypothetical protein [Vibrio scophthalmi]|uniref:Uncharacterized protein n=1 Tax=Vibrio scophthalmi TaxID=45658 RepID=A0A1E3WLH6_9VIBR|nr:hypothetical protein [Vibrio scophthalmi]ODS10575.1 hypothetical protein VSF3289_00834 [Vibrio scophthalmi]